jgi:uncharacterized protein YjiS (DUF1127 family)
MTFVTAVENLNHFSTMQRRNGHFLDGLLRVEAWLDARRSRRMLYRLDSRGLADIGLTESDLDRTDSPTSWHGILRG